MGVDLTRGLLPLAALALLAACAAAPEPREAEAPRVASYDTAPASCADRPERHPELDRPLLPGRVDPVLLDRAVRLFTNAERCAAGLAPVAPDPALARAALLHARDMAAGGYVAPVRPGERLLTLRERLRRSGVAAYDQRGENLMRIDLATPGVMRTYGARACLAPPEGPPPAVAPTYRSIARRLVETWRGTEAYTVSMLEPRWSHLGAAVAIRPAGESCGDVYAAQTFVAR